MTVVEIILSLLFEIITALKKQGAKKTKRDLAELKLQLKNAKTKAEKDAAMDALLDRWNS